MVDTHAPLADRLRPSSFDDFVGQEKLVGKGKPFRKLLEKGFTPSVILWGPPGTGKTTLAHLMAKELDAEFIPFSAVTNGLPELRKIIALAEQNRRMMLKTVLFIDEIHRWNKAQQDALLPHVESGTLTLIGATTENPSFEVIGPLLSRAQVFRLDELEPEDLQKILNRVKKETSLKFSKDSEQFLVDSARGDARTLLNSIEMAEASRPTSEISVKFLEELLIKKALRYDKNGEEHYNVISAFIKSLRGSDPDAAVYYMARMIEAGEDPKFIARRMVVFASEDVGNADPQALQVATAAAYALEFVGLPEARINLSQAATYL
ncbi:replication-associated recombination protein A, partial [Patescibacteria group bacterium]|nr:replication-associated recombination protein A [Patescibacteria group bacterium]